MISLLRKYPNSNDLMPFSLTIDLPVLNSFFHGKSLCVTSTGRSALRYLFKKIGLSSDDTLLLPAYVPEGIIRPVIDAGVKIKFYQLNQFLMPNLDDLKFHADHDATIRACILIHPLGFEISIDQVKDIFGKQNIMLIEDCAQGILSQYSNGQPFGSKGDFAIYSLNKFFSVPDGAVLISHVEDVNVNEPYPAPSDQNAIKHYMSHLFLNEEIFNTSYPMLNNLLQNSANAYEAYYSMINYDLSLRHISEQSLKILSDLKCDEYIKRRRENCHYIYQHLDNKQIQLLFDVYTDNIIPLAIPALVPREKRDSWCVWLRSRGIILSTLVERWDFIPKENENYFVNERNYLQSHVLIPINEFLSEHHMKILVNNLNHLN